MSFQAVPVHFNKNEIVFLRLFANTGNLRDASRANGGQKENHLLY